MGDRPPSRVDILRPPSVPPSLGRPLSAASGHRPSESMYTHGSSYPPAYLPSHQYLPPIQTSASYQSSSSYQASYWVEENGSSFSWPASAEPSRSGPYYAAPPQSSHYQQHHQGDPRHSAMPRYSPPLPASPGNYYSTGMPSVRPSPGYPGQHHRRGTLSQSRASAPLLARRVSVTGSIPSGGAPGPPSRSVLMAPPPMSRAITTPAHLEPAADIYQQDHIGPFPEALDTSTMPLRLTTVGPGSRTKPMPDMCAVCACTSTPEWRRGPAGIRSLCNSCGLVYAKKRRERETTGLPHPTTPEEMVRELQSIGAERFKTSGFRLPPGTLERVRITIERTNEAVYSVQTSRARSKSKAEKGAAAALLGMRRGSVSSPSGSGGSTELPSPDASAGDGSARPLRSPSPIPMAPPLSLSSSSSSGPRMSLQNLLTSPSDAPAPPNRSDSWATLTRSRSRSPAPRMSAS